jgi:hypothetical protein
VRLALPLALGVLSLASCAPSADVATAAPSQRTFATPEEASEALIDAAERFDVDALKEILGPDGLDLVVTEDTVRDRDYSTAFAEEARVSQRVEQDPEQAGVAILSVGADDWPLPIPIVQEADGRWRFDSEAGREEILLRRIGNNELTAIEVCRGYVEAQYEYASQKRDGSPVNQYAQHVISTPGRHDGLAWQGADGTWQGPVGEGIARVIDEGYTDKLVPYHGYYFKILKGQGPDAPFGEMEYVIRGVMIGGFALVAAPADYRVTGVKTFIVSHNGLVYEKDLGPDTVSEFKSMTRYNPDATWEIVPE